jgi:hypothetical protein
LSILPAEQQRQIIDEWVDAGGGTAFDPASEAEALLEFIAGRLNEPSHVLAVCRMEQAVYRASEATLHFRPPDPSLLDDPDATLCTGRGATLVRFFAEPQQLFGAIKAKAPLPPMSYRCLPVLFAPGLPALFRAASKEEALLFGELAGAAGVRLLTRDRCTRLVLEELFRIGAVDLVPKECFEATQEV